MTTTPQAALLSRMDAYLSGNSCEATAIIKNARDLLAKLQAAQEPVQEGELPPPPTLSDDERQWLHYNPNTSDIEEWVYGYAVAYARAALSARKPLTDEQRAEVFRAAESRMVHTINLSWRNAVVDEVERAHGIGLEVKP